VAQPVWTLSVDLQTKTATFQTGLADAAKAAKGSFTDIKQGAREMASDTSYSMGEARHGIMLLGEEFGVHLPRGITSFLASLGPVGAAMEAAFPFLAIALGATLLLEHLAKIREEGEKAAAAQADFGITANKSFMALDQELLRAGIEMDELSGNHMAALRKELQEINNTSLQKLMSEFDILAKGAEAALDGLKTSWYQFGAGSAGAKHSLEEFKREYDGLLAQGKDKEALALLDAKVAREREILKFQEQAASSQSKPMQHQRGDYNKFEEASIALKKLGVGFDEKEIKSQTELVDALTHQVTAYQKINDLRQQQSALATKKTDNKMVAEDDKRWQALGREAKQEAEDAERAWDEAYKAAVSKLQENERQKIDATHKGSQQRLAAIDAAIKEENGKGLQATEFYKSLLTDRVNLIRQMAEEQEAITQKLADDDLKHAVDAGTKLEQARMELARHQLAMHQINIDEQESQEIEAQNALLATELAAYDKRIAALDKSDEKYIEKLRAFEEKKTELIQQNANEQTKIQNAAEERKLAIVTDAENRMGHEIASTAANSIIQGKNMEQAFAQLGVSMMKTALTNLMQIETVQGRKRFGDARTAAADAFESAGNPILGAIEAAAAFSAVMAFERGGIVPGTGNGDVTPAMLTPGEAVLPKNLTDGLMNAAKFGNLGGNSGPDVHIHYAPTQHIQALDGEGVGAVLEKHADVFHEHVNNAIRKMNR
jgi:hypothetical protein